MTILEQKVCDAIIRMSRKNEPEYWEKLKHQATIAAMQGMLSNHHLISSIGIKENIVPTAKAYAEQLIEEFKNKENK